MRVVVFANGSRGAACLERIASAGHEVCAVVVHSGESNSTEVVRNSARNLGFECLAPKNPNSPEFTSRLREMASDVNVLAGYSHIVSQEFIDASEIMTINTHAGELPGMRGSSPLNWALIEGRDSVTLSIIQVTRAVDGGDVLAERHIRTTYSTTIADLQDEANRLFPEMLVEVLNSIASRSLRKRRQEESQRAYYPLRFPDDGLILWDQLTAEQVHNRIRALTHPYPGAFTFGGGRRIRLLRSELTQNPYMGEPGRVYRKTERGLLVCAADRCLWVTDAVDARTGEPAQTFIDRYERLATVREAAMRFYESGVTA